MDDLQAFLAALRAGEISPQTAQATASAIIDQGMSAASRGRALVDRPGPWTSRDERRAERLLGQTRAADDAAAQIQAILGEGVGRKTKHGAGDARALATGGAQAFGGATPRSFQAMFGQPRADTGWRSIGDFIGALASGMSDRRFVAAARASDGQSGGYAVPEQFVSDVFNASLENELVRPRARIYPVLVGGPLSVAGLELEDHTGGVLAGLKGAWLGELQTATDQTPKFKRVVFDAKKLAIFVEASHELASDSPSFEADLQAHMALATAFNLDSAFLTGSGVGQPQGVLDAPATIAVLKETSQAADTLLYKNVVNMAARLTPGSWNNAIWVASQTTLPELLRLQFQQRTDTGALIADQAVAAPIFQINGDGTYALLGRPLILTEKLPPLGDRGDILLADFSCYGIALRSDMAIERSIEAGWQRDAVCFRIRIRADGRPLISKPTAPVNGATTSPFVTLAERA